MPFALLDEQVKVLRRDSVDASQMALCLVPEILDSADVACLVGKDLGMVDAHIAKLGHAHGRFSSLECRGE